jgi:hypothetical protein
MTTSDYSTKTFTGKELPKIEAEFSEWINQQSNETAYNLEIISSNMFSAPTPGNVSTPTYSLFILFTKKGLV